MTLAAAFERTKLVNISHRIRKWISVVGGQYDCINLLCLQEHIEEIITPDLIMERERLSLLAWLFQLLGSWGQPIEEEKPPEPVDPASCESCSEYIL